MKIEVPTTTLHVRLYATNAGLLLDCLIFVTFYTLYIHIYFYKEIFIYRTYLLSSF